MTPVNRRAVLVFLGAVAATGPARAAGFSLSRLRSLLPFSRKASRQSLLIAGSTTMVEINLVLAEEFSRRHPDVDVVVDAGGSLPALIALKRGSIDIAAMRRALTESEDEKGVRSYLVARDALGIIVSNTSKITALTSGQVHGLLRGQFVNWAQVGGDHAAVHVVVREDGTPSRLFIEDMLDGEDIAETSHECETPRQVMDAVAGDPNAIGVVLLRDREASANVRYLPIDGVDLSTASILSDRYPFVESLCLTVKTDDLRSPGQLFVNFVRSASGQEIVAAHHLVATC